MKELLEDYIKKTKPEYYPPVENLLDLIYEHYTENNPVEKNTVAGKAAKEKEKELEEKIYKIMLVIPKSGCVAWKVWIGLYMTMLAIRVLSGRRLWIGRERCVVHGRRPLLRKA